MNLRRQRYLIYDGDCGFCNACVSLATAYDRQRLFILAPFQALSSTLSPTELQSTGLTEKDCRRALQAITPNGKVLSGAMAINYFLWQRWTGKILVTILVAIPLLLVLELAIYGIVARYRHRLSEMLGLRICTINGTTPPQDRDN